MSSEALHSNEEITSAVVSAVDGWRLVSPLQGFGWAPARHMRTTLKREAQQIDVIVRQSWSKEGYDAESFLYAAVLPHLKVKTPRLWGTFELASDVSQWMILEDLHGRHPEGGSPDDERALFTALGQLHGEGLALAESISGNALPVFTVDSLTREWMPLLASAVSEPHFELPANTNDVLRVLCCKLTQQPHTLLHGDTDTSNILLTDGEAALIDWERAKLGPPSLDLGKALEAVQSEDALTAYRSAFNRVSQRSTSDEQVQEWADLAVIHNCLHWICYYIRHTNTGSSPDKEWRREYYEPCVRRLRETVKRWSGR